MCVYRCLVYVIHVLAFVCVGVKRRVWKPAHTSSGIGWEDKGKETLAGGRGTITLYRCTC